MRSQLTSEQNFWELLEMELQRFLESGRKTREEEKREYEKSARELRSAVFGVDEDEDIEMDETCEDDDDFEKIFQKLFDNLLGDDDNIPEEESEVSELKNCIVSSAFNIIRTEWELMTLKRNAFGMRYRTRM